MTDVLIKRELLERIDETAICDGMDATISDDLFTQLVAALDAPRQPAGWKLVPERMHLDSSVIETIQAHCGDGQEDAGFGPYSDGVLWIGECEEEDGSKTYGLHIATADYPEEGSSTLVEFAAAPSAPATVQGVNTQLIVEYPDEMANGGKMANCNTDCRSAEGVTVGLIDGLITIARVLTKRDLSPAAVQEALIDLRSDEDLARVLGPAIRKGVNQQLLEALEGMVEYFPEGSSDGECFSVDAARDAIAAARKGEGK